MINVSGYQSVNVPRRVVFVQAGTFFNYTPMCLRVSLAMHHQARGHNQELLITIIQLLYSLTLNLAQCEPGNMRVKKEWLY